MPSNMNDVNSTVSRGYASVLSLSNSTTAVIWQNFYVPQNYTAIVQNARELGSFIQIYDCFGKAASAPIQLNIRTFSDSFRPGDLSAPAAVALEENKIATAYVAREHANTQTFRIYVRIVDFEQGELQDDTEFLVNTEPSIDNIFADDISADRSHPTIASLSNGRIVIGWQGYDGDQKGIFAKILYTNGSAVYNEFQVNSYIVGEQSMPKLASLATGFVVVWESRNQFSYNSLQDLYGQIFNDDGTTIGNEFRINSYTPGCQVDASVIRLGDKYFVVAWNSNKSVHAQVFYNNGTVHGDEFIISKNNNEALYEQILPSLAAFDDETFLATWGGLNIATNLNSIYGVRLNINSLPIGKIFEVNRGNNQYNQTFSSATTYPDGSFAILRQIDSSRISILSLQEYDAKGDPCNNTVSDSDIEISTCLSQNLTCIEENDIAKINYSDLINDNYNSTPKNVDQFPHFYLNTIGSLIAILAIMSCLVCAVYKCVKKAKIYSNGGNSDEAPKNMQAEPLQDIQVERSQILTIHKDNSAIPEDYDAVLIGVEPLEPKFFDA